MKIKLLMTLIEMIVKNIATEERMKSFADKLIDLAEDYVEGTEKQWDDMVVLPFCKVARKAFDIQDND